MPTKKSSCLKTLIIVTGVLTLAGVGVSYVLFKQFIYHADKIEEADQSITAVLKPFDHKAPFKMPPGKYIKVSETPEELVKCYLSDISQKDTKEYEQLKEFLAGSAIRWYFISVLKHGYYETDDCFAAYINPEVGFTIDNYKEAAEFSEIILRRMFAGKIKLRGNYSPAENTELISLVEHPEHFKSSKSKSDPEKIFGFFSPSSGYSGKVFINTDTSVNKNKYDKKQLVPRLSHEYLHSFSSPNLEEILNDPDAEYSAMIETLTEYFTVKVVKVLYPESKAEERIYAVEELLKYITLDELEDAYFNGSTYNLKTLVDSKTYNGAFCSLFYYSAKLAPYGQSTDSNVENVLKDPLLKVDGKLCAF